MIHGGFTSHASVKAVTPVVAAIGNPAIKVTDTQDSSTQYPSIEAFVNVPSSDQQQQQ